jgi:hypothetical protein
MIQSRPERWLTLPVEKHLVRRGFTRVTTELPFFEQRIDVYGYAKTRNETVAVELKLTKWKRAVKQALLYQLCADLVYVAMPARSAKRVHREELSEHGIGLISVADSGRCAVMLPASRSHAVSPEYTTVYSQMLAESSPCRRRTRS